MIFQVKSFNIFSNHWPLLTMSSLFMNLTIMIDFLPFSFPEKNIFGNDN